MTGPAAPPAGEGDTTDPRGREFYQTGPWLVVYGHGTHAEARARQAAGRCHARGVHFELVAVDEVAGRDLSYYMALIVFLPSVPSDELPTSSIDKIVDIIKTYRARRPYNLTSLLDGSRQWFKVGVVQVFGTTDAYDHARLQSVSKQICLVHYVEDDEPVDPFAVYQTHGQPPSSRPESTDQLIRSTRTLQAYLHSWGLSVPEDVSRAREGIEGCRSHYENPRYTALYRPIPGRDLNRLDFLLDEPGTQGRNHKKWMENGARTARDVFKELERQFPDLNRPNGRASTKDAQQDLRKLYQALRAFEAVSKVTSRSSRHS